MSKAILKFDLSDPDDLRDFKRVTKSNDMAFLLYEIFRNTKKGLGYDIATKISEAKDKGEVFSPFDALDLIYETLFEKLNEP